MLTLKFITLVAALILGLTQTARSEGFTSPDILILGDSQIPFGSGPAFVDFFADLRASCMPAPEQAQHLDRLGDMRVGVIGVRSTSIGHWTARSGSAKDTICKEDRKWKVNAGTFGSINTTGNKYKQIGKGHEYQFCAPQKSALEQMLRPDYYAPKLVLLSFLGNSAKRWAASLEDAQRDVEEMMRQLPSDLPCIFMTTAPAYSKKITDLRLKAQANLQTAFEKTGSRCSFVPGTTPQTVAANQGNPSFFRRNESGRVKDPYHPNKRAAKHFFELEMGGICNAVFEQIAPVTPVQLDTALYIRPEFPL